MPTFIGPPPGCSVDGCERVSRAKRYAGSPCDGHHKRGPNDDGSPLRSKAPNGSQAGARCSVDGCDRPRIAQGWCALHRERFIRTGSTDGGYRIKPHDGRHCVVDDCQTPAVSADLCQTHYARRRRGSAARTAAPAVRKAVLKRQPLDHTDGTRTCVECGTRLPVGDYPLSKYGRLGHGACCRTCREHYSSGHKQRRRAALSARSADLGISARSLRERDGDNCCYCGRLMRFDRPAPQSEWATIEHLVPVSKGGSHTWDNVRLACKGCNSRQGNRGALSLMTDVHPDPGAS